METTREHRPALVACPDARPPAYQAVVGLDRAGLLDAFRHRDLLRPAWPPGPAGSPARAVRGSRGSSGCCSAATTPGSRPIASGRIPSFDLAIRLESRIASRWPRARRAVARLRTDWFDAQLARIVDRSRPGSLLVFSDVGSDRTLPSCRRLGIPTILSMVHGDVREEAAVLERGGRSVARLLADLPGRRAARPRRAGLAARAPAPRAGPGRSGPGSVRAHRRDARAPRDAAGPRARHPLRRRLPAVPPARGQGSRASCTFLFAGGISQRKGIKYLLEAWRRIRRPGWRLQLLGPLPRDSARSGRISTRSSPWAGSVMPRCPPGWRRPTSSCSPRSSRARPS